MFQVAILSHLDGTRGQNLLCLNKFIKIRLPFKTAVLTVRLEIQVGRLGAVNLNLNASFFQTNQNPSEHWLRRIRCDSCCWCRHESKEFFIHIFHLCGFCSHWQSLSVDNNRHCSALLKWGAIAKVVGEVFWFGHSMTSSGTGLSLARRRESN